ncbi:Mss4-like protein [Clohesyomyces aquaticus]|uniref:Mss4-like protein n=1 Tax=Clohesyomyces aquaticus TaxID=1231657 RepID=A0A1Y2A2I3_9PLEO|nr:Mss4-like protein [Clohesyomyces aquaticus]
MARPESISGGCLCGAIRFTITFPQDTDWPPTGNGICQCTMCRKHSGSLLPQNCKFPTANISPPLKGNPAFKTYNSSSNAYRGFCGDCGSALTFHFVKEPEFTEINLGAFDEEVLCGKRDESNAWEDEHGRHVPRIGGVGRELCYPQYHIFMENAIPGVTDDFPGPKYLQDKSTGKPLTASGDGS